MARKLGASKVVYVGGRVRKMASRKQGGGRARAVARKVTVDAGLKARWNEAIERYRKARDEELEGWDERYEALGEILDGDPPYYLAGGYKTARDFLQAEVPDQDERVVRAYVRVARYFDPEDEKQHGIWKLDALLNYLEEAGGLPLAPLKINAERQRVPVAKGKRVVRTALPKVSVQQIRQATRQAAAKAGKVNKREPELVRALRRVLSKARLSEVAVSLRAGQIVLGGIRPARLTALGKALAKAKIEADED
jgi:hypothetical protein